MMRPPRAAIDNVRAENITISIPDTPLRYEGRIDAHVVRNRWRFLSQLSILGLHGEAEPLRLGEARFYAAPEGAEKVCLLSIGGVFEAQGRGACTDGGAYHAPGTALAAALASAGITIDIDLTGSTGPASEEALKALGLALIARRGDCTGIYIHNAHR